jgi:hypothetical protein
MDPEPRDPIAPSLAPEHDWAAASRIIRPALRPVGTAGDDGLTYRLPSPNAGPGKPLMRIGPAGLPVVYVIPGRGFDVVVGVEHLQAWGVRPQNVDDAAIANLRSWSDAAGWSSELSGTRLVMWSDGGDGMDAARLLLPEVREKLAADLAPADRILVAVPERDLLIAARLNDGDGEFAGQFAGYVEDRATTADEPIDRRVFELSGGELSELAG